MQALVGSAPDGHTLALATVNQAVFDSYLFSNLPYDPFKDFEPISLLATNSSSIAVAKTYPANTFNELVALVKAQPGKLTFATALPGTFPYIHAHMLAHMIGIDVNFVTYKSGLEGLTGVMRGDVQMLLDSPVIMVPEVRAGTIRVLTVTGHSREPELPDVPTIAEAGFPPSAEYESWFGLVAPSRTSPEIVARLNREVATILTNPGICQPCHAKFYTPQHDPRGFQ